MGLLNRCSSLERDTPLCSIQQMKNQMESVHCVRGGKRDILSLLTFFVSLTYK